MPMPRKEANPLPVRERLLVSTEDAANMIDMSYYTTSRMIKDGLLPSVRVGDSIRVPVKGLEKWIERNTTGGTGTRRSETDETMEIAMRIVNAAKTIQSRAREEMEYE